ncbi:helix-turn-helix domain-containing protein [Gilliamella sp. G0441]|uniref:helix-turn-helix domain-containing protein n=1 Tax=Gilliamella sp. G0441 TaxID=3384760 RepID=UPI003D348D7D
MTSIYSEQYQYLIKTLREARTAKGITQRQLASALNRCQSFVAKIEMGERKLDVVEFILISRLLGLNTNPILDNIYKNKKPIINKNPFWDNPKIG